MAQYVFDARKYPVGTRMSDLGWWSDSNGSDYEVVQNGSNPPYWRSLTVMMGTLMSSNATYSDCEILIGKTSAANNYKASSGATIAAHGHKIFLAQTSTDIGNSLQTNFKSILAEGTTTSNYEMVTNGVTTTKNVTPSPIFSSLGVGFRLQLNATDASYKLRVWYSNTLEASESSDWNVEGSTQVTPGTPYSITGPASFGNAATDASAFNFIAIGTDGDPAPWPDEALVLSTPTVQATDLTGTTATISWS